MKTNQVSIILVVGLKNSGKTAFLEHLLKRAKNLGFLIGGFLSRGNIADNHKKEYFLEDLQTGSRHLLAATTTHASRKIRYGSYHFNPKAFELGNQLLLQNFHSDLLVLDEFGPLELQGKGFRPAFDVIIEKYPGIFLIAVRPSVLPEIQKILSSKKLLNSNQALTNGRDPK